MTEGSRDGHRHLGGTAMTTAIRETAAPWYLRQAEFDGVAIVLLDDAVEDEIHPRTDGFGRYSAIVTQGWNACGVCGAAHWVRNHSTAYEGDSLEEAEAAYAELERKLLAGELEAKDV